MKIVRHVARDMRQAMRAIRERLGDDAVILSSRRVSDGVEVTAAIDFDAESLEAQAIQPLADVAGTTPARVDASAVARDNLPGHGAALTHSAAPTHAAALTQGAALTHGATLTHRAAPTHGATLTHRAALTHGATLTHRAAPTDAAALAQGAALTHGATLAQGAALGHRDALGRRDAPDLRDSALTRRETLTIRNGHEPVRSKVPPSFDLASAKRADMPTYGYEPGLSRHEPSRFEADSPLISSDLQAALLESLVVRTDDSPHAPATAATYADPAKSGAHMSAPRTPSAPASPPLPAARVAYAVPTSLPIPTARVAPTASESQPTSDARVASTAPASPPTPDARVAPTAPASPPTSDARVASTAPASPPTSDARVASTAAASPTPDARVAPPVTGSPATAVARTEHPVVDTTQPLDLDLTDPAEAPRVARAAHSALSTDLVGTELKNLRRMLETQLSQLAWNDMTRRAPVHTEMLRELSEIGIAQDLASQITQQLPQDVDLTYARRFSIAALSQYLLVTGDRWLDNGGRIAFIGSTGVGKTMTLSKLAVRWVLRHGARELALVGADNVRLGAQDQMRALGQLLGVPVYTPENFETLPTLLSRLQQRFILIDTPGSSLRDTQLSGRLAVLASSASQLQTALVLAASTQAGALEEVVKRFAPANPCCCVVTKIDEAASLGGALSVLIRARVPVSYVSEGQRVPEDLRPARALELVSNAVRLAKASGAAADEDLLRRRFGKIAHALT